MILFVRVINILVCNLKNIQGYQTKTITSNWNPDYTSAGVQTSMPLLGQK